MSKTIPPAPPVADGTLDITSDTCPKTFVRPQLAAGQTLPERLRGTEPRRDVPAGAAAPGHAVTAGTEDADGATLLRLRRA